MSAFPSLPLVMSVSLLSLTLGCTGTDDVDGGEPATLDRLVERNMAAMGGEEAIDSLRNIDVVFGVVEPSFTARGRYRAASDGRMRVDVFIDGSHVFSEGIDGSGPWQRAGPGAPVEPVSEMGAAALRHGIEFALFGLHRFSERGHELSYAGRETVDGTEYPVVKATLRDGFETYVFIDPATGRVARRRDVRALHPDFEAEQKPLETVYTSYDELCGTLRATRSVQIDLRTGDTVQTTRTLAQTCNRPMQALGLPRDAPARLRSADPQ